MTQLCRVGPAPTLACSLRSSRSRDLVGLQARQGSQLERRLRLERERRVAAGEDQTQRLLTDGPFAETREQLGGYTIIEASDLDEAVAIASGFVGTSTLASIEVRPIVELEATWAMPAVG